MVTTEVNGTGSGSCLVADVGSIDSSRSYVLIKKISKWLYLADK